MDVEKWLKRLLQITGWLMATAVFAVFLPHDTMGAIHERLGLGNFPEGKIVDYLARSTSAFYAMIGVLYIILARDLRVYAAIITFIAWANIAFGILLTATGWQLAFPLWWTLGEGPLIIVMGFAILWLQKKMPTAEATDR